MKRALSGISKIFLLICLASAFIVDLSAFILLAVQGMEVKYWIFHMFFAVANGIFIVQAVFSNFRFAYTVGEIVFYMIFSAVMIVCTLAVSIYGGPAVFTSTAGALWTVLHMAVLCAVLASYLYASKRVRAKRVTLTVITAVISAVCVIFTAYYAIFMFGMGYFGQGPIAVRPLAYEYDEEADCYEAKAVLNGRGASVYIPDEFNGKKVSKVSYSVFCASGVNSVTLACSPAVEFTDANNFRAVNADLKVHVSKDDVIQYGKELHKKYTEGDEIALGIANRTVPYNLENDEVFVSFSYSAQSFEEAGELALPVWMGKKGDTFDMRYFKDIPYAMHSDRLSDEDLHYNFSNNNGYVISPLLNGDTALNGVKITESIEGVEVNFEKIYRVYAGDGNDAKHLASVDFKPSVIKDAPAFTAKYTTAENADKILQDFARDGFNLRWEGFKRGESAVRRQFTSLGVALEDLYNSTDFYIYPVWSLKAPALTVKSDREGNRLVYGEDITLTSEATAPANGVKLEYEWTADGANGALEEIKGGEAKLEIVNIPYNTAKNGAYSAKVVVKASADFTSLTSQSKADVSITVTKRPIDVLWTLPQGEIVYNAFSRETTCAIDGGGVINGDSVALVQTSFLDSDAGTHSYTAALNSSFDSGKYVITSNTQTRSYTIKKAPITAKWENLETTFNNTTQKPEVSFSALAGDIINYTVSGALHAGKHTVTCTLASYGKAVNYELMNPQETFTINQLPVDVKWNANTDFKFTYDGYWHDIIPTAVAVDSSIYNHSITAIPSVSRIKHVNQYEITATVGTDYIIKSGSPMMYTIDPCTSQTVYSESASLTYNGKEQSPNCYIIGIGEEYGQRISVYGSGQQKDAGNHYVFNANTCANSNYFVNSSINFNILPCTVDVVWTNRTFTYDGNRHLPEAHAYGVGDDGELTLTLPEEGYVDANHYTVFATLADGERYKASNYNLSSDSRYTTFDIERVNLTARADDITITEGEALPNLTYTVTGFVNGEHFTYSFTCEIEGYSGGNLSAGTYKILVYYKSGGNISTVYPSGNYVVYFETGTLTVLAREA